MSKLTNKYKFLYFQEGDFTTATSEMQRWESIDAQLYGLFSIMGNGVIDGWDISTYNGLTASISPGKGHVAFISVESKQNSILSLTPNSYNYIYAITDSTSYWTKSVHFSAYPTQTTISNSLYIGKLLTDYNGIVSGSIDSSGRTELGFIGLVKNLVKSHKHIGGTDNPSPIDLSSEVQGVLGVDNIPDLGTDVIKSGIFDVNRLPSIDHKTKLTGVGSLTHAQLDSFVEQFSIANQKLMGEVSTTNLLQLVLALKHIYPDIDEFLVNEIAFIPGISPDSYIDTVNTTATVDTRPASEGGQHTITGTPSQGTKTNTKVWDSEIDFSNSTNNNVYIFADSVTLSVNQNTMVLDNFDVLSSEWSSVIQDTSSLSAQLTLDSDSYVVPPSSLKINVGAETIEIKLLIKKIFEAKSWSGYKYLKFYIKTDSVQHGDLFFYFKDGFYGDQNSYTKVLNRNTPTINQDTLENGWQEVTIDLQNYAHLDGIVEFGFYVTTKDGWDTSKKFDLNIDNLMLTSGNIYEKDGYIRLIYGNNFPYRFWRVKWDAIYPTDSLSNGASLQSRCRVADTIPDLEFAIWTPYSSVSGYEIAVSTVYKYIEVEFYFTASETQYRSVALKKAYLDYYVSDIDNSFEYSTKSDWDSGNLFNIDTETVPGSILVSNIEDINTYYYGSDKNAFQLDGSLNELYKISGTSIPLSTYQVLNDMASSLGTITGVARGNNGNLWISDIDNDRVLEVDKSGNLIRGFYGSFLNPPVDNYGKEENGPGSNIITSSSIASTTSTTTLSKSMSYDLNVLHSIYNPENGKLYVIFNKNLENIYDEFSNFDINRFYIRMGGHKISFNSSTYELLGVDKTNYNIWYPIYLLYLSVVSDTTSATNSITYDYTKWLAQFDFKSHVLQINVEGADRTLMDYFINMNNPSVVIASPYESQKMPATVTVDLLTKNVDLSTDSLRITLDGTNVQTIKQRQITFDSLSSGRHSIKVEVLNNLNVPYSNIEASLDSTFVVEGEYSLPIVSFNSPKPNQIFSSSPAQIDFSVSNFSIVPSGQHIKYYVDSEEPIDYFSSDPILINDILPGKHTISIFIVNTIGDEIVYPYGRSTLEFIVGVNSNAYPILYVEPEAIKDSTNKSTNIMQKTYIDPCNISILNVYSPIDVQIIPEDNYTQNVSVLISKLRSQSWTRYLAGQENATELLKRMNNEILAATNPNGTPAEVDASLANIPSNELVYGTKYLNGHSVTQLDMDGNTFFSNNAAIFADTKSNAKNILGSAEKIGANELLIADSTNKRAIIVNFNMDNQTTSVEWEYDSDRTIPDFHIVPQNEIVINVTDGNISDPDLFVKNGTTVIWENNSSEPISIYSGYTTFAIFQTDPSLDLYGKEFKSGTLQPGERYSFKFNTVGYSDWFVYPSILTAKVTTTTQRLSDRDQYLILESDGLESPFTSRVIKVDSWGNVIWSFGEAYLVKPRDARPLINNNVLVST